MSLGAQPGFSRFENFDLIRAISEILNVKGLGNGPSDMDNSSLKWVISVGSPIMAPMFTYEDYSASGSLDGLSTTSLQPIALGETEIARVLAMEVKVSSPTKISAVSAATLSIQGFLSLGEEGCKVFHFPKVEEVAIDQEPWEALVVKGGFQVNQMQVATARFPGTIAWDGLVPPGKAFNIQIDSTLNFPANTTYEVRLIYALGPAPFQPPL